MADSSRIDPSTTPAAAAVAQSRDGSGRARPGGGSEDGGHFRVGPRVVWAAATRPYDRGRDDPIYRPLRIYTLDPSASRLEGAIAVVNVPYEPVGAGPRGALFRVDPTDRGSGRRCLSVDLDARENLIRVGRSPSTTDPEFHQQMVYAVCSLVYAAFRRALGRDIAWAFDRRDSEDGRRRLVLYPHGGDMRNAYYDEAEGCIVFGYFEDIEGDGEAAVRRGRVFSSLSHDIVAHEVTHALLHGLRAHFSVPTGPDVLAFHEAFADLVALFQHFSYRPVVEAGIQSGGGDITRADLLVGLAQQFGRAVGRCGPLRRAIEANALDGTTLQYRIAGEEPHARGAVLVSAVFRAFATVFRRKAQRYIRLATQGSGIVTGALPAELQAILADEASKLADQFLTICIRAIDYCPPVDIEFGEFLRAVITADYELVPDDPHAYREAWINAFRDCGIYPSGVQTLSEDALLWRGPARAMPPIPALSFREMKFDGDPARPPEQRELVHQAEALGRFVSHPDWLEAFGLARPGDPRLGDDTVEPPIVESIRTSRRIGPDGQILFDLVAEIAQPRRVRSPSGDFTFLGGATLILDPKGNIRYVIAKDVRAARRLANQRRFLDGTVGRRLWTRDAAGRSPARRLFCLCHEAAETT